jgi:hypothetical protein
MGRKRNSNVCPNGHSLDVLNWDAVISCPYCKEAYMQRFGKVLQAQSLLLQWKVKAKQWWQQQKRNRGG